MFEDMAGHPAQDELAEPRMGIGAHDEEIGLGFARRLEETGAHFTVDGAESGELRRHPMEREIGGELGRFGATALIFLGGEDTHPLGCLEPGERA